MRRWVAALALVCAPAALSGQAPAEPPQLQPTIHAAVPENVDDFWFAPRPADRGRRAQRAARRRRCRVRRRELRRVAGLGAAGGCGRRAARGVRAALHRSVRAPPRRTRPRPTRRSKPCSRASPKATCTSPPCWAGRRRRNCAPITPAAAALYDKLSSHKSAAPDEVLTRLARASLAAGDRKRAAEAFQRVYYEFPLTEAAAHALATRSARCRISWSATRGATWDGR